MKQYKDKSVRLTFGCSGWGVFKDIGPWMYDVLIDLHGIQELYNISFDPEGHIGANVTLTQMIDIFEKVQPDNPDLPYLSECAQYMKQIANTNVRNVGTWAGNLILKKLHPEFPSDIFVMLETIAVQVGLNDTDFVSPQQLLTTDLSQKVITVMVLPTYSTIEIIKFYRVSKRTHNSHAYVNAGFRMNVDKANNFLVKNQPCIVFGGINKTFTHASKTEAFLTGKQLLDPNVIKNALLTLQLEIVPDSNPVDANPAYRRNLALAFFYRYVLYVLGDHVGSRLQSGSTPLVRSLSSGQQTYDTNKQEWPLTEPLQKLEAKAQVTGEAEYVNDIPLQPGELHAAFVISTVGNAKIQSIDASAALLLPGVLKVLTASDIPAAGVNNCMPSPYVPEEVLCSGEVLYAGQSVALVIAENQVTADFAASLVKVTYSDIKPPILTIQDAVKEGSLFPKQADEIIVGNAEDAIAKSPKTVSGSVSVGTQFHFPMETQVCICIPTEDGMKVHATTQWTDYSQKAVALVLGIPSASIDVEVKRLGGAFGSKISKNFIVSAACALAAYVMKRPVRLLLNFHTNIEMMGKRFPYAADYQVGFDTTGKLNGVKITYYCDCGCSPNDCTLSTILNFGDNTYYCPNWHMIPVAVKTNSPSHTYCRAPGSTPGIFIMETIMEHIAKELGVDPTQVKTLNLYQKGQVTPGGMPLPYCSIGSIMSELEQMAEVQTRQQQIQTFNAANRWKKMGMSVVPIKYGVPWNGQNYGVLIAVYSQDGTVAVSHGGVEVGQGINTKVAQVVAYEFEIPVDMVKLKPTTSFTSAGSGLTGSSVTSELCCQAAISGCQQIKDRMAPVKAKMDKPTWLKVVQECFNEGIDLSAHAWFKPDSPHVFQYNSYGTVCAEVEFDVLTGDHQITRVDLLYDCGESINPGLDIGQVEGAFVMGLGYWLTEECKYDPQSGQLLTNDTWEYKPPLHKDIPIDFRVHLLPNAPNPLGVLRAKACGEPPLCMSCSSVLALKHAIEAARKEIGQDKYFELNGPATVEALQMACLLDPSQFVIQAITTDGFEEFEQATNNQPQNMKTTYPQQEVFDRIIPTKGSEEFEPATRNQRQNHTIEPRQDRFHRTITTEGFEEFEQVTNNQPQKPTTIEPQQWVYDRISTTVDSDDFEPVTSNELQRCTTTKPRLVIFDRMNATDKSEEFEQVTQNQLQTQTTTTMAPLGVLYRMYTSVDSVTSYKAWS
ncbi:hypothetical protein CHS0354_031882 [Potamilus streckersoni]|uniref:FAD-binding PCMH-type domain-containing protein n=1 Tax=Potamilus streckersoni TaxID=2493646 RepID=A0AAE0RXJ3_9BIVA|nr:hypothetical protein CHS0354_031882 [Potamilus streckersoni]